MVCDPSDHAPVVLHAVARDAGHGSGAGILARPDVSGTSHDTLARVHVDTAAAGACTCDSLKRGGAGGAGSSMLRQS